MVLKAAKPDPFHTAKRRLLRADKHIANLEIETNVYLRTERHKVVHEPSPGGTHVFHKIKFTERVPDEIMDITFDAVSNLRASLDAVAYPIVLAHKPHLAKTAHFPIRKERKEVESASKDFPDPIRSFVLDQIQSYEKGHGHRLWVLSRVRNQAEHRIVINCNISGSSDFSQAALSEGVADLFHYVEGENENEIILAISPVGKQFYLKGTITPFMAFGADVELAGGEPIIDWLNATRQKVATTIHDIEAEATRLGVV
jgi:hypothetical protein